MFVPMRRSPIGVMTIVSNPGQWCLRAASVPNSRRPAKATRIQAPASASWGRNSRTPMWVKKSAWVSHSSPVNPNFSYAAECPKVSSGWIGRRNLQKPRAPCFCRSPQQHSNGGRPSHFLFSRRPPRPDGHPPSCSSAQTRRNKWHTMNWSRLSGARLRP